MKKRILAIVNPIAGTSAKTDIPSLIKTSFCNTTDEIDVIVTQYAGHALELSKKAVENGTDIVIAVGGDGTVNEIAKGLIQSNTALGIVPVGSGNGLARDLHIPISIRPALQIIKNGNTTFIDYGTANGLPFFCTFGLGFDAQVSERFAQDGSRGFISYIKNSIEEYANFQPEEYRVTTEHGEILEKAFLVNCANTSQLGNNAYIAPHARLQDGKMTVTLLKPFPHIEVLPLAFQLFNKQIDKNRHILSFESRSLTIERQQEGIAHLDGEPTHINAEIKIETVHLGLKVIIP